MLQVLRGFSEVLFVVVFIIFKQVGRSADRVVRALPLAREPGEPGEPGEQA